jgi:DNA-binding NtrC family response regulator
LRCPIAEAGIVEAGVSVNIHKAIRTWEGGNELAAAGNRTDFIGNRDLSRSAAFRCIRTWTQRVATKLDGEGTSMISSPQPVLPSSAPAPAVSRRSVLIVEDNDDQRALLAVMLSDWGYATETARDGQEAIEKLSSMTVHIVLADLTMPRLDGVGLLRWMAEQGNAPPTIVMTAYGGIHKAVSMVHDLGAYWFLEKPLNFDVLRVLLARAADHGGLVQEKELLQRRLAYSGMLGDMVGKSPEMEKIFALIQQVAPTRASVLITGESGTGKEVVARTIHRLSPRRDGPFVAINCAALPESLIESELFGHEKGSFTGAAERRAGCFELAEGGTLFLDEIAEMPPAMQVKLLRTLEDNRVRRLGAKAELPVDVRLLAATNKSPEAAVSKGELRADLYYRLNVFHIAVPPLREHKEDIPLLVDAMLGDLNRKNSCRVSGLDPLVLKAFEQHDWPGNVRELRNILERAVIVAGQGTITLSHLPPDFSAAGNGRHAAARPSNHVPEAAPNAPPLQVGSSIAETEKRLIWETLRHTGNNKTRAAFMLGISLKTLHNKLKKYGPPPES